jgi:Lrp/AsnC family transcriptional regulator for asnA, asnC and gidA
MNKKVQIDETDRTILSFLIKNARTPFLEIARACGISGAAIHQRIKKLEDAGIISGSKFTVKPKAVGFDICAFVGILLDKPNVYNNVIKELGKIPEIVECHFTTGTWALLVKIYCVDNNHLMDVLVNKMQNIPGVGRTESFISLEQTIDREFSIYKRDA